MRVNGGSVEFVRTRCVLRRPGATLATTVRAITAITLVATTLTGCSSKPDIHPVRIGLGRRWELRQRVGHRRSTNTVTMTLTGIKGLQHPSQPVTTRWCTQSARRHRRRHRPGHLPGDRPAGPHPAHVVSPNSEVYVTNSGTARCRSTRPLLSPAGRSPSMACPHGLRAAGGSVIVVANTMDGAVDLI